MSTTDTKPLLRTHQGQEIPAPGAYVIDTSHSSVEFAGRHLGLAKVRGRFTKFGGNIDIAEVPEQSSVEVDIDVASVESADARRDELLRSPDFFHVEEHPSMVFKSSSVTPADGAWDVCGDLTIRGVTRPVGLHVAFEGAENSASGDQRSCFSATTQVNPWGGPPGWKGGLT